MPLFALLLVAFSLHAAITAGPERPVSEPTFVPAFASRAAVASNARGSLVAWTPYQRESLYIQRLDVDGEPLTPHGIAIATAPLPPMSPPRELGGVATDGERFVVIFAEQRTLSTVTIGANGEIAAPIVQGSVRAEHSHLERPRIASNGTGYVITWVDSSPFGERLWMRMLDRDGAPVGDAIALTELLPHVGEPRIVSNGREYLVSVEAFDRLRLIPISAAGVPAPGSTIDHTSGSRGLVWDGASYVVFWTEIVFGELQAFLAQVESNGRVGVKQRIAATNRIGRVVSNGNGSVLFTPTDSGLEPQAMRLAPGGLPIDATPRPVTSIPQSSAIGIAANGDYLVLGLYPAPLAAMRVTPSLQSSAPQALATTAAQQSAPSIVAIGNTPVIAWREGSTLRVNGHTVSASAVHHTLAAGRNRALLAWQEARSFRTTTISTRLVDESGAMTDSTLIAEIETPEYTTVRVRAATATGDGWVVVWELQYLPNAMSYLETRLWHVMLDRDGKPRSEPAPLALPFREGFGVWHIDPTLVATPNGGFLIVYDEFAWFGGQVATAYRHDLYALAFAIDGTPAGRRQIVAESLPDAEVTPSVASDGAGNLLVAYSVIPLRGGPQELYAVRLSETGEPTAPPLFLGHGSRPLVAGTGSEFLVFSGTSAAVLNVDGSLRSPLAPLFTTPTLASQFAVANAPGGAWLTYVRTAPDLERGEADQVMLRRIGDVPARRRSVR